MGAPIYWPKDDIADNINKFNWFDKAIRQEADTLFRPIGFFAGIESKSVKTAHKRWLHLVRRYEFSRLHNDLSLDEKEIMIVYFSFLFYALICNDIVVRTLSRSDNVGIGDTAGKLLHSATHALALNFSVKAFCAIYEITFGKAYRKCVELSYAEWVDLVDIMRASPKMSLDIFMTVVGYKYPGWIGEYRRDFIAKYGPKTEPD